MSWFELNVRSGAKTLLAALVLPLLLLASGCTVRPLYATDSKVDPALKSIVFSEAETRVELQLRNDLIFLTSGGAGEPANPEYQVDIKLTERNVGVLLDLTTDLPRAGRLVLKADFTLKRISTGEILRTGHRSSVALVDFPGQQYAKLRAINDAENRSARELAELIRADLAVWMAR